jgi:DNA polymerase III sliding clamp (beta) subunit (PCNA family)
VAGGYRISGFRPICRQFPTVATESMKTNSPNPDVDARLQPLATIARIKAIAPRADLLSTLQVLRLIAKSGKSLPITSGVMIVARGNSLKITADNCEIMCRREVPAKIDSEGAVVLSAERLVRLLTYATDDELQIDVKDGESADLTCGDISAHFAGWPVSDFVRRGAPVESPRQSSPISVKQGSFKMSSRRPILTS